MTARRAGWIGCAAGLVLALSLSGGATPATAADLLGGFNQVYKVMHALSALHEPRFLASLKLDYATAATGTATATLLDTRLFPSEPCYVDAGKVTLQLQPVAAGVRITGLDLPDSMPVRSPDGREIGTLRLADYRLTGRWSEAAGRLTTVDEEVTGLSLETPNGFGSLTIGSIRSSIRVTQSATEGWQEKGTLEVRDYHAVSGDFTREFSSLIVRWTAISIEPAKLLELTASDSCAVWGPGDPSSDQRALSEAGVGTAFQGEVSIEGLATTGGYAGATNKIPEANLTVTTEAGTRKPAQWQLQFVDISGHAGKSAQLVLRELGELLHGLAGFAPAQLSFQFPELDDARGRVAALAAADLPGASDIDIRMDSGGSLTVNGKAVPSDPAN